MKTIPIFLVRINYTSGLHMEFWVTEFSTRRSASGGLSVNWTWFEGPKPLLIGVDTIESVYQMHEKKVQIPDA